MSVLLPGVDADTGAIDRNHGGYAACAVCQPIDGAVEVYVQWGRTNCSSGHSTEYSGLVMSQWYSSAQKTQENACVDREREMRPNSVAGHLGGDSLGARLYTTEMRGGSSDEALYPQYREVACAVCSVAFPPTPPMPPSPPPSLPPPPTAFQLCGADCNTRHGPFSSGNKEVAACQHGCNFVFRLNQTAAACEAACSTHTTTCLYWQIERQACMGTCARSIVPPWSALLREELLSEEDALSCGDFICGSSFCG